MTAIALVGGDGSGKTTLARELVNRFPQPVKYLYMGLNASSSNIALPSTRLIYWLKVRSERKARRRRGESHTGPISLHGIEYRGDSGGRLWAVARLANRIAEESFRQIVSWVYQARGFVVVYDRHFLFDFTPGSGGKRRLSARLHLWFLEHIYPKPHLVLFLDAPASVQYARKQEVPEEHLEAKRAAYLARGSSISGFVAIDASQSPERVYAEAARELTKFLVDRTG